MYSTIGGIVAVYQLANHHGVFRSVSQENPVENIIGPHKFKTLFLPYDRFLPVEPHQDEYIAGITLTETKIPGKKDRPEAIHHSLSIVRVDMENMTSETIDGLVRNKIAGVPSLLTMYFAVAKGDKAQQLYEEIDTEIPQTAMELADILQEKPALRFFSHPSKAVTFPGRNII